MGAAVRAADSASSGSDVPANRRILPVGPVDLDLGHPFGGQVPSQPGAVDPGACHTDDQQHAEVAQPGKQLPIAGRSRRELAVAQHSAGGVHRGPGVGVLVGVHAAGHLGLARDHFWCDGRHRRPSRSQPTGRHAPPGKRTRQ
jgi:hypothetical protein